MKQPFVKFSIKIGFVACVALLSACDYAAHETSSPGDPENLLDISKETVTFGLGGKNAISKLASMVDGDRPSEADMHCSLKSNVCAQAKEIFERNAVNVHLSDDSANNVVLVYERVIARDCNPHYIDNMSGGRTYNHPSFGCAVAGNIVQMVSDKSEFTNPSLLDFPDAEKAEQSYDGYMQPSSKREVKDAVWSVSTSGK